MAQPSCGRSVPCVDPDDRQCMSLGLTAVHVAPMDGGGSGSRTRDEGGGDGSCRPHGDPTSASDNVLSVSCQAPACCRYRARLRRAQIGRRTDRKANRLREQRSRPGGRRWLAPSNTLLGHDSWTRAAIPGHAPQSMTRQMRRHRPQGGPTLTTHAARAVWVVNVGRWGTRPGVMARPGPAAGRGCGW
jgi:hypothetical protein